MTFALVILAKISIKQIRIRHDIREHLDIWHLILIVCKWVFLFSSMLLLHYKWAITPWVQLLLE